MFVSKSRSILVFLFDIMALNLLKRVKCAKSDLIFKRGYFKLILAFLKELES